MNLYKSHEFHGKMTITKFVDKEVGILRICQIVSEIPVEISDLTVTAFQDDWKILDVPSKKIKK